MDEFLKNAFNLEQWKHFEKTFGEKFPFPTEKLNDLSWIEGYVQDVLQKSAPGMAESGVKGLPVKAARYRTETFETISQILVKIRVADPKEAESLHVQAGVTKLLIDSMRMEQAMTIKLPAPIVPQHTKAIYKDGILHVYMRKKKMNEELHEVYIRHIP